MTIMYSPLVYAQAVQPNGYGLPPLPPTFGMQALTPPGFNPYSANAADRTQYWVDTAGTLTEAQARLACYGLAAMQTMQIDVINAACGVAIEAGFPATIEGRAETVTLSPTDQVNALMAATTAQAAEMQAAWAASKAYPANSAIVAAGDVYITFAGGTSGATAPTWPTAFSTPVTDGAVTWYRLGFWVGTTAGNVMIDAAEVIALYAAGVAFVSQSRSKYQALKDAIMAATTPEAVLAIVWA